METVFRSVKTVFRSTKTVSTFTARSGFASSCFSLLRSRVEGLRVFIKNGASEARQAEGKRRDGALWAKLGQLEELSGFVHGDAGA